MVMDCCVSCLEGAGLRICAIVVLEVLGAAILIGGLEGLGIEFTLVGVVVILVATGFLLYNVCAGGSRDEAESAAAAPLLASEPAPTAEPDVESTASR